MVGATLPEPGPVPEPVEGRLKTFPEPPDTLPEPPDTLPEPVEGHLKTLPEPVEGQVCSPSTEAWWTELPTPAPSRVGLTQAGADLLVRLVERHGPVIFHQSGGCCDGSAPMCYPQGDLILGDADVHLGDLHVPGLDEPVPVYMSRAQFPAWRHTHLTIDAVPGRGAGFSLEAPEGLRFLTRSRLLRAEEGAE